MLKRLMVMFGRIQKNKKKNKKSKKSADTDNGSKNIAKEDAFDE